jgi:hypothetical protein
LREERRLRVFGNRVLRKIIGPRKDEETREWRKLNNEKFNDLYSSSRINRMNTSRRMRWAGNVAPMGKGEVQTGFSWGNLKENHFEDPGVDGRIIIRWIFKNWCEGMKWIDLAQNRNRWWDLVNVVMNIHVP